MVHFEFAYNNPLFSDTILHLEVVSSPPSPSSPTPVRLEFQPKALLQKPIHGHEDIEVAKALPETENSCCGEMTGQTKKIYVSSVILAAHSDYFMRLYLGGMSESNTGIATLQVSEEEQKGLQCLIQYMYTGRLVELLDAESTITLLSLADRFAISSCMEPLAEVLKNFPNSLNDCLLILGLPESLKANKSVHPVVEQCRNYLAQQFQNISLRKADFLALNIEGVKVVLDSDTVIVSYEEEVFNFMLEWLETNCHDPDDKLQASKEIAEVVRFPWMTGDFLVDVVTACPQMQSEACQALVMEALKFKSYTHSRQQQMIWKKTNHNRYRPRNNLILENFWGNSKTFIVKQTDVSCQVYFEFPLELVICTGQIFQSRPFSLGGKYLFNLEARHGPIRTSCNQQVTCCISLVLEPCSLPKVSEPYPHRNILEYNIAMKRDYSQNYETKASGSHVLPAAQVAGTCITFPEFFSGWFIERGFSFPRWNLTINGPVFLRLDLGLRVEEILDVKL
ncbi:hypothetical protein O6H91_04G092600 [Diphasiastrum complanatum]|uniref:Uncharacterized protein n=1 Tax=Diphasiastrum complanatum TaxID=34168 RepID=A0ACC2DZF1_DIPCM|nr:hypothetical protein O6H91_04G092600 [Diphasiastrum complanatum]